MLTQIRGDKQILDGSIADAQIAAAAAIATSKLADGANFNTAYTHSQDTVNPHTSIFTQDTMIIQKLQSNVQDAFGARSVIEMGANEDIDFATTTGDGNTAIRLYIEGDLAIGSGQVHLQGSNLLFADNLKSVYGFGKDSEIYYDGTDLILSPRVVGTGAVAIGVGATGVDYQLKFRGFTNTGIISWMDDEDYFQLEDTLSINDWPVILVSSGSGFVFAAAGQTNTGMYINETLGTLEFRKFNTSTAIINIASTSPTFSFRAKSTDVALMIENNSYAFALASAVTTGVYFNNTASKIAFHNVGNIIASVNYITATLADFEVTRDFITGRAVILKPYTNASRPAASLGAGALIFNTDDNFPNVSDGTNWRDMSGVVT